MEGTNASLDAKLQEAPQLGAALGANRRDPLEQVVSLSVGVDRERVVAWVSVRDEELGMVERRPDMAHALIRERFHERDERVDPGEPRHAEPCPGPIETIEAAGPRMGGQTRDCP